jgi:hypothetical protein
MVTSLTNLDIEREIRNYIGSYRAGSRPFLCEGSPIGCEVFLIGLNPAVAADWWSCWNHETGFDRKKWIRNFEKELSNGRNIPGAKTRLRIELLRNQILPYRVLDMNLYHIRSDNLSKLKKSDKKKDFCDCLIKKISPKLIFLHGKQVVEHFAELAKVGKEDLKSMDFTDVEIDGKPATIFAGFGHLCMYWTEIQIVETGKRLNEWCRVHNLNKD